MLSVLVAGPAQQRIQAKISAEFSRKSLEHPTGKIFEVTVRLFEEPSPQQKRKYSSWLRITDESSGPVHLIQGDIQNQHLENLLNLSIVRSVEELELSQPGN